MESFKYCPASVESHINFEMSNSDEEQVAQSIGIQRAFDILHGLGLYLYVTDNDNTAVM